LAREQKIGLVAKKLASDFTNDILFAANFCEVDCDDECRVAGARRIADLTQGKK
jgi:hypothetical protein